MNENLEFLTVDIEDPAGTTHEVTVPADANTQQFIDSLVTMLNLPVIAQDDAGITYLLSETETKRALNGLTNIADNDVIDGTQLQLLPSHETKQAQSRTAPKRPHSQSRRQFLTFYIRDPWTGPIWSPSSGQRL